MAARISPAPSASALGDVVLQNTFRHFAKKKKSVEATFDGKSLVLIGNYKKPPQVIRTHRILRALAQQGEGEDNNTLTIHHVRMGGQPVEQNSSSLFFKNKKKHTMYR